MDGCINVSSPSSSFSQKASPSQSNVVLHKVCGPQYLDTGPKWCLEIKQNPNQNVLISGPKIKW